MGVFFFPLASRSLSLSLCLLLPLPSRISSPSPPPPPPGFQGQKPHLRKLLHFLNCQLRNGVSEPASQLARPPAHPPAENYVAPHVWISLLFLLHLSSPNSLSFFPYLQEWHTNSASWCMRGGKEAAAASSSKRRRSIRREIFFLSSMRLFFSPFGFFFSLLLGYHPVFYLPSVCLSVYLLLQPPISTTQYRMVCQCQRAAAAASPSPPPLGEENATRPTTYLSATGVLTYTLCPCLSSPNTQRCVRLPLYSLSLGNRRGTGRRKGGGGGGEIVMAITVDSSLYLWNSSFCSGCAVTSHCPASPSSFTVCSSSSAIKPNFEFFCCSCFTSLQVSEWEFVGLFACSLIVAESLVKKKKPSTCFWGSWVVVIDDRGDGDGDLSIQAHQEQFCKTPIATPPLHNPRHSNTEL